MMRLRIQLTCLAVALVALLAAFPATAQCDNGREGILSDTFLGSTAVEWRMLVEHRAVTLTVSAPCGLVVDRTYEEGKSPSFDIREIPANNPDGVYTWQLRVAPHVDPEVEKMLMSAREKGDDQTIEYELRQKGALPEGPFLQTGSFTVFKGSIVPPDEEERESSSKLTAGVRPAANADNCPHAPSAPAIRSARLGAIVPAVDGGGSTRTFAPAADGTMLRMAQDVGRVTGETVISGDLTVYNSLCVGFDCATSETYGADTIRLKENNLRIHFEDTSAGTFPSRDWRIEINSQTNGGQSHFRINDVDGARSPFTIEAAAPSHSLYVDSSGRIGRKTANPVLEFHIVDGDTPAIRLQQDTSSGFGAQTWDIAGNETNFFVRDASSGSTLPFRIFPGSPSSSLVVRDGDVGVGTASPQQKLHVTGSDGSNQVLVEETSGTTAGRTLLNLRNNGQVSFSLDRSDGTAGTWSFTHNGSQFNISKAGTGANELAIFDNGNVEARGSITGNVASPSSRALKQGFSPVNELAILSRVRELPIFEWSYMREDASQVHLGPVAEDFHAAFRVGDSDKIYLVDANGVALAAIQGLSREIDSREEALLERIRSLEELVHELRSGAAAN